jgi:hypothetical protein
MFWLHLNDHWCFGVFLTFVDFILEKVITFVWKELRCRFVLIPNFLDAELSFSTGAEMSWCRTVLFPLYGPFFFLADHRAMDFTYIKIGGIATRFKSELSMGHLMIGCKCVLPCVVISLWSAKKKGGGKDHKGLRFRS